MSSVTLQKPAESRGIISRTSRVPTDGVLGVFVGAAAVALLLPVAFRGWIPHDEGTLGQSAVRILSGEWPHADFMDVYPGLLGVIHAGVFQVLGESIASLRIAWLGVAATAAVSLFLLLRHRLGPWLAVAASIGLTLLAFVIYPASMPTWWNVSLGLAALALVHSGWMRASWMRILAAGLITGMSVLIKTTGGAFIAIAIFIWLVSATCGRARWLGTVSAAGATAIVVALVVPALSLGRLLLLGIPAIAAVAVVWLQARTNSKGSSRQAGPTFIPWVFAGGVIAFPVFFIGLYLGTGRLDALLEGWISSPALRFEVAEGDIPLLRTALLFIVLVVAATLLTRRLNIGGRVLTIGIVAALAGWGFLDWADFGRLYLGVVTWLAPAIAFGLVSWRARLKDDPLAVLVGTAALLFILVQIPLWNGYYAGYTLPLLGLTVVLLIPRGQGAAVALVCMLASLFLLQSMSGRLIGPTALDESVSYVPLANPRAGISVPEFDGYYDELATRVAEVSGTKPIYAGPDAPEVAFLAGVTSATGGFFEILDEDWDYQEVADLAGRGAVVVINQKPGFSTAIPEEVEAQVFAMNVEREEMGKFIVTWSDNHD